MCKIANCKTSRKNVYGPKWGFASYRSISSIRHEHSNKRLCMSLSLSLRKYDLSLHEIEPAHTHIHETTAWQNDRAAVASISIRCGLWMWKRTKDRIVVHHKIGVLYKQNLMVEFISFVGVVAAAAARLHSSPGANAFILNYSKDICAHTTSHYSSIAFPNTRARAHTPLTCEQHS